MKLNMIQINLSPFHLAKWARERRIAQQDTEYLLHAAMRALYDATAPQPFFYDEATQTVLGYSENNEKSLCDTARLCSRDDGELLRQIFHLPEICCKAMPEHWQMGQQLHFEVRCMPLRRHGSQEQDAWISFLLNQWQKARDKGQTTASSWKDYYNQNSSDLPEQSEIYRQWLDQQFSRDEASRVVSATMAQFQTVAPVRRSLQGHKGAPQKLERSYPQVTFQGVLKVTNSETFTSLLARGIGRHRAFGYGMILLRRAQ